MFNFNKGFDFWSFLYAIGLFITFAVSIVSLIFSFYNNKKTLFINTVTSERTRWITKLKDYLAEFYSSIQYFSINATDSIDKVNEVNMLRIKIKLYLNPIDDKQLIVLVDDLYRLLKKSREMSMYGKTDLLDEERIVRYNELEMKLEDLIDSSQKMLKDEWERIKMESINGYKNKKKKQKIVIFVKAQLVKINSFNIFLYCIIAIVFFIFGSLLTMHNTNFVTFIMMQRGNIIIGIITGIISSTIISQFYKNNEKKRTELLEFQNNKQEYEKFLGVIRNEIELYKDNDDKLPLIRILNEPHWYNGFKEENLLEEDKNNLVKAFELLKELQTYLNNNEYNKVEMDKFRNNLFKCQLNILKMKANIQ
ncbi:MAG TPA: hypothetical protein VIM70_03290 [Clostridium sp.]|uniref:hypothetical protein n=1 Tax=Clostridium sp. TaxID=1506 RepID=UPI002F95EDC2